MYDLLHMSGTLKGNVGEEIYSHVNKYAHRTKLDSYDWIDKMSFHIPLWMKYYLIENWNTIDAFEFLVKNNKVENIIFYEIKTTWNRFVKMTLTHNCKKFYLECKKLGFIVKSVYIYLEEDWKFDVVEKVFDVKNYKIHSGNIKYAKKV